MMKKQEIYVTLNDNKKYRINYTDWGDGDKLLICVHGLTRNSRDFDYLAKTLSENHDYRVICLDMPGRGESEYLPDYNMYNYDNYKLVIIALIKMLNLETPINYLGTSMGGLLAISLAQDITFNKLIFNDIGFFVPKESLIRIARYISIFPKFQNLNQAKEHLKIKLKYFGIKSEENWDYITLHSTHLNNNEELILNYDLAITNTLSLRKDDEIQDVDLSQLWLSLIFNKLLILRGKTSDVLLPQTAQEMIKSKKNVELIEFDNVGHTPALMEKDQLDKLINWLVD